MKTNLKYFNMLAMPRTCAKWDGCWDHWKKGHKFAKARKAREAQEQGEE